MQITVFRKKVTPRNGNKPFNKYVTTLVNKEGKNVYTDVVFEDGVKIPDNFPVVLEIEKKSANLNIKRIPYKNEKTGEEKEFTRRTLWIKAISGTSEYVDNSLDDFD